MTVKEFMIKHSDEKSPYYLIPNAVSNQTFSEPYWKSGFYANTSNVLDFIGNSEVVKAWHEEKDVIIIWKNE